MNPFKTGCAALDILIQGRFPTHGVIQYWSEESPTAITTAALSTARSAAEADNPVFFVGTEGMNPEYRCSLSGMSTEHRAKLIVIDVNFIEDLVEVVEELADEPVFLIFDCITRIGPRVRIKGDDPDEHWDGYRAEAKFYAGFMARLRERSDRLQVPTLITSFRGDVYPPSTYSMGDALAGC